jgi:alpha-D-xyloside xylohydrolase
MKQGYLLKKNNGDVWQTDLWQAGMGLVDFTNAEAISWYQGKLRELLHMGVDCFKTDFGERIPVKDIAYFDSSDPVKMHNYYTYLYNQAVFELLEEERGVGEAVLFARSATVGSQKFPVHWGGDCSANYPSMAESLRSGLSLACAGFGFWSHDISGFESTAPVDVYKRWCQFGLMSSHSRLHGSSSYRVPWLFDDEACDVLRTFVKLKCRLMPYLYRQAMLSHKEGTPMMRPMFVEFPEDRGCDTLDKQYMLGDSILVAPVFKESGEVEYYLPKGKWYNLLTGKVLEEGGWQKESYDFFTMPLLIRQNSIVAIGGCDDRPDYDYSNGAILYLSMFEDEGTGNTAITDLEGKTVMTAEARREGDVIFLHVEGGSGKWTYETLGDKAVIVVIE